MIKMESSNAKKPQDKSPNDQMQTDNPSEKSTTPNTFQGKNTKILSPQTLNESPKNTDPNKNATAQDEAPLINPSQTEENNSKTSPQIAATTPETAPAVEEKKGEERDTLESAAATLNFNLESQKTESKSPVKFSKAILLTIIILLLIIAAAALFYFNNQKGFKLPIFTSASTTAKEGKEIVNQVSKLVLLPEGENPQIETATESQNLKNQSFFTQSQVNDIVLTYQKAKKAILYRPGINRIIDIATITDSVKEENGSTEEEKTQDIKFVILNGTSVAGLAKKYQEEVQSKIADSQIVSISDAKNKGVEKTFIVAINNTNTDDIALKLGIESGPLPKDEATPDTDYIIILGQDKSSL